MIELAGLRRAYCGPPPAADGWLTHWNVDPLLFAILALAGMAAVRLPPPRRGVGLAAIAVLAIAFVSPLCALTTALFAARSVHHLLLAGLAAPLLALAWPRAGVGGGGSHGGAGIALAALVVPLWAWHVPALYAAALDNVATYWAMQIALLAGGWLFWARLIAAPAPLGFVLATAGAAQMGLLGALLTFARVPLYAPHFATTVGYGMGPLADQQLAGLVMWVPGMAPFAFAAGWIVWTRFAGEAARA